MTAPKQFICMKWGTLYGSEYANRLYAMVRRHTTGPIRFVCLTDDRTGLRPEIECHDCPSVPIPAPANIRGWRKVSLWADSDKLFGLVGDWMFLDLDLVVTGSLDEFFTHEPEKPFIVMRNWTQPGKNIGNTSAYRFRIGSATHLFDRIADFATIRSRYNNSQTFISREHGNVSFWPDAWCVLFKVQCVPPWPMRYFVAPTLPEGARIVAFPGQPNPPDAARGHWPEKKWHKRLYKVIRPAKWIDKAWTEAA